MRIIACKASEDAARIASKVRFPSTALVCFSHRLFVDRSLDRCSAAAVHVPSRIIAVAVTVVGARSDIEGEGLGLASATC